MPIRAVRRLASELWAWPDTSGEPVQSPRRSPVALAACEPGAFNLALRRNHLMPFLGMSESLGIYLVRAEGWNTGSSPVAPIVPAV